MHGLRTIRNLNQEAADRAEANKALTAAGYDPLPEPRQAVFAPEPTECADVVAE